MAAIEFIATPGTEVALTAATAKTVLQILAPTNQRVRITSFGIFFDGSVPNAEPVVVKLVRQTSAGSGMTAVTLVKTGPIAGSETIQTQATHTATSEPTTTDILDIFEIHPQAGVEKLFPLGREIIIAGGTRLGLVVTSPAAVNCIPKIFGEE